MLDAVTKGYLMLHPVPAARTLARLDGEDAAALFTAMPRQLAAQVLGQMAPASAGRCLQLLPPATASEILTRMPMLAATMALRGLDKTQVQDLLTPLPRPKASRIRLRLRLSEWAIGAFIDDDLLTLSPDDRVGDALRLFRRGGQHTGQTLPVIDTNQRLVGVVDLCELLGNSDRRVIRSLMQPAAHVLSARAALQTVINHPAWITHDSLPVVDRNGTFQGVLRRSHVMEKESRLMSGITERNEIDNTRAALADIFWLAVGAVSIGAGRTSGQDKRVAE